MVVPEMKMRRKCKTARILLLLRPAAYIRLQLRESHRERKSRPCRGMRLMSDVWDGRRRDVGRVVKFSVVRATTISRVRVSVSEKHGTCRTTIENAQIVQLLASTNPPK